MAEKGEKDGKGEGEQEAAPVTANKGGKKKILIIVGVVLLLLAIGTPVIFMTMKKKTDETALLPTDAAEQGEKIPEEGANDEEELADGEEALGALFPMETFVVNLSGGRYIRVQMAVEFAERDIPRKFYTKLVPVRDTIISLLTSKSQDDVLGDKGRDTLRDEVRDSINEILHKQEVRNVYFTQFIVQ